MDALVSSNLSISFFRGEYEAFIHYADGLNPHCLPPAKASSAPVPPSYTGFSHHDALPHLIVGFQMGLTVTDYNWGGSLACVRSILSMQRRRALLVAHDCEEAAATASSSSELEASLVEIKARSYLKDPRYEAFRVYMMTTSSSQEESQRDARILSSHYGCSDVFKALKNPLVSLQTLQSGTLGNDIWYKNRFVSLFSAPSLF
jgi:hypothetical protein